MNKNIEIFKNGGFYSVFGDSAYVMHYLFNYKIIDNRVGFPKSAYDRVINKLEELNINYVDSVNNKNKDFKKKNKYNEFVLKGKKKYNVTFRINSIMEKLDTLSEDKIDEILSFIESKLTNE